jgi:ligand-binding SRPBCC domain-containing protein
VSLIEHSYGFEVGAPCAEVFGLLSDARVLNALTPRWFDLEILSDCPGEMYVGKEISYWLRWRGLRFRWQSRVTAWEPSSFFAYEQIAGPFCSFVHEHCFFDGSGSTWVTDRVTYRPPGGGITDRLIVAGELARIFSFRERVVEQLVLGATRGLAGRSVGLATLTD